MIAGAEESIGGYVGGLPNRRIAIAPLRMCVVAAATWLPMAGKSAVLVCSPGWPTRMRSNARFFVVGLRHILGTVT
jgi:hypothetical protein